MKKTLLMISIIASLQTVWADVNTAKNNLAKTYPNTPFQSVTETPIAGIYQVVMGKNIAYTDEAGKYFYFWPYV